MMIQSKFARRSLALAVGAAFAVGSQFALAATQSLGGKVTIEPRDISTEFTEILNFGDVKVGPTGGTVTLTNDGTANASVTGDVVVVNGGTEGKLGIQGEKNYTVTVTVDATFNLAAKNIAGAADLTVTTAGQGSTLTLLADNGSWNYFQIGGTLTIPGSQPADVYEGTYNATVNYQ